LLEHVSDECDDVEASKGGRVALVVFHEPSTTRSPGEGPLHNPTSGQQNEASLGLRQLDHLKLDPFGCGCLRRCLASIALIDIGEGYRVTCRILDIGGQAADSLAIADIGRRHMQSQQMA
jgi:hypothetical protein